MLWALYGLLHSFLRSAFVETNRTYRIDPWVLAFGQALVGLVMLLCFIPFMHWPQDPHFYRAAVGVALIFAIGTIMHLTLCDERAGRVSGIYMPLESLAATLIWIAVTPALMDSYTDNPLMTACLVVAFMLVTGGMLTIRPSDISWRNFFLMAPLGITYAVAGNVTKTIMVYDDVMPVALAYALLSFAVMAAALGLAALLNRKLTRALVTGPALKACGLTGLVSACAYTSFVISVTLAPNPGYTSMLAMLLPVWLLIWHSLIRVEDKAAAMPALCIIIGCALLIVATF